MTIDRRNQVADQCRAIVHQAQVLAEIHKPYASMLRTGHLDELLDQIGKRTAELMEYLGDTINGMDAATDEDAFLDPIFEGAHAMFPVPPPAAKPGQDAKDAEIERIAVEWDGCMYESVGESIDIGAAIRGRGAAPAQEEPNGRQ